MRIEDTKKEPEIAEMIEGSAIAAGCPNCWTAFGWAPESMPWPMRCGK